MSSRAAAIPDAAVGKRQRAEKLVGEGDLRGAVAAFRNAVQEANRMPPCPELQAFKVSCMCQMAECNKRMNVRSAGGRGSLERAHAHM